MKRVFSLLAISLLLAGRGALAEEVASTNPAPDTAAALAAQQAADERYKRMAADIQALQMDNESLKAKVASLEQKIEDLRQQTAAAANNTGVQEDLKRLAEKIEEVDRKREQDKQAISEEIRKSIGGLEKTLAGSAAPTHAPPPRLQPEIESPAAANGYSYTIHEGDNLSTIVKAYNADFKNKGWKTITLKQAKEANPSVDWNRLLVGQKIIIPRPDGS